MSEYTQKIRSEDGFWRLCHPTTVSVLMRVRRNSSTAQMAERLGVHESLIWNTIAHEERLAHPEAGSRAQHNALDPYPDAAVPNLRQQL